MAKVRFKLSELSSLDQPGAVKSINKKPKPQPIDKKGIFSEIKKSIGDVDPITRLTIMSRIKKIVNAMDAYVTAKPDVGEKELFYVLRKTAPELSEMFDMLDLVRPLIDNEFEDAEGVSDIMKKLDPNVEMAEIDSSIKAMEDFINTTPEDEILNTLLGVMEKK